ncbi:ROK family protein [Hamadaea sp. NPDC051192]|uniref:ROK family transcriptional regulator n=1 Tax=Hamadaea sp. NPDC051192 TaxID=3154940 RepID=UPI00343E9BF3
MTETPPATQMLLRRINAQRVLDLLRTSGQPSRVAELAQAAKLSRPTVDAVVDDLLALGLVDPHEDAPTAGSSRARGRPARRYGLRTRAAVVVGVDIGSQRVRAVAADLRGETVGEVEAVVDPAAGRDGRLTALTRVIRQAAGGERLGAVAVGVPGVVADGDEVRESAVLPSLSGARLGGSLSRVLGCPVTVDNDANLAALGERWLGVASDARDMVFVLSGERLGAGIILGGELVRGYDGSAGEMGFLSLLTVDHAAEGIGALMRRAQREMYPARPPREPEDILRAAVAGEADAVRIRDYAIDRAARAIAAVSMLLAPELVVIGGGVADAGHDLIDPLADRLGWLTAQPPRLAVSALGGRAVVAGALRLALDVLEPTLLADLGG